MNSKVKKIVTDKLRYLKTVEESKGVIILYKGKQLIMESGKRIWTHRRHASCALSNYLNNVNWLIASETGNNKTRVGDVVKELEKEGIIEFKELN